jgi:SAM-dependent MidA family methyltransferase
VPTPAEPTPVARRLAERVDRHGPRPFSEVVELALYDPELGFYAAGGAAGRRGDFLTSPEVGPLFGAVVARALDGWWAELGEPDPFVVVEVGAGAGTLARSVLAARPRCGPALRYVLVERSAALRVRQRAHLPIVEPATALGAPGGHDGPVTTSLGELPSDPLVGVVIANELLDNLAFDLVVRTGDGWAERRVDVDPAGGPTWVDVPADEPSASLAHRLVPDAPVGAVVPLQRAAAEWARSATATVARGRIVVLDYAVARTTELARRPVGEWLRTYRGHERAGDPLDGLGLADVTVEVCVDQLERAAGPATAQRAQAEFLRSWGIDELVAAGRAEWGARAAVGDLAALRARSRVREAEALLDPDGLGAFRVVEWVR